MTIGKQFTRAYDNAKKQLIRVELDVTDIVDNCGPDELENELSEYMWEHHNLEIYKLIVDKYRISQDGTRKVIFIVVFENDSNG